MAAQVERLAALAQAAGLDGVVASPQKPPSSECAAENSSPSSHRASAMAARHERILLEGPCAPRSATTSSER